MLQRAPALDNQGIDHGLLKCPGHVGARLGLDAAVRGTQCADRGGARGLETAEAEFEPGAVGHRARKPENPRPSLLGQLREEGAAGIVETEYLGDLVERLARRIIERFAENPVASDAIHPHQLRVSARDQQGHERKLRRLGFEHRRQQVRFHMVHADCRDTPGKRQRTGKATTDQQRPEQARPRGIGHAVDTPGLQPRLAQHLPHQRQQLPDVIARGEFRHHAAVLGMHRDLAVEHVRQQAAVRIVDRDPGFIAGCFYSEHAHLAAMIAGRRRPRPAGVINSANAGFAIALPSH